MDKKTEEQLSQIKRYSLSDSDIKSLLGGDARILTYPEFAEYENILDCFDEEGRCVFLFLTTDANTGHWLCMFLRKDHIEYFDSYAKPPEAQRQWISRDMLEELGEGDRLLYKLMEKSKVPVYYNRFPYQKDKYGYNTCGRWVCARLMNNHMSNTEFRNFVSQGLREFKLQEPDDWVCIYTASKMGK
jgi:hypothetical protein